MNDMGVAPPRPGFTVAAAVLLGAAAVVAVNWVSSDGVRLLIALAALVAGGVAVRRRLIAIGSAAIVLGAYLTGVALAPMIMPESRMAAVVLGLGLPALALLGLAARGLGAGAVGAGILVPLLVFTAMVEAEVEAASIAKVLTYIVIASVLVVLLAPRSRPAGLLTVLGAVSAFLMIGPATSSGSSVAPFRFGFGWFETGTPPPGTRTGSVAAVQAGGTPPVLVAVALAAGAILLAMAFARGDRVGALAAAAVFAAPPMMATFIIFAAPYGEEPARFVSPVRDALVGVPVAVGGLALIAAVVPPVRGALARVLRVEPPVAALVAAAAVAGVVLAVRAVPVLGWSYRVEGLVVLAVLGVTAALAMTLRGLPGAVLAGATLAGLQLGSPWSRLIHDTPTLLANRTPVALVGMVAAAAVAVVLVLRHRRTGVLAAAAYAVCGALAQLLEALLAPDPSRYANLESFGELATVMVLLGPVLLLGVPAAVVALRGRDAGSVAAAQAVGVVVLLAGGLAMLRVLLGPNGFGVDRMLDPFTPTAAAGPTWIEHPGTAVLLGVEVLFGLGLALALSAVGRLGVAPLVAAVTFVTFACARTAVLSAPHATELSSLDSILWTLVVVGGLLAVLASARRTDRQEVS